MTTTGVWLPREPRNSAPAIVMRFHDDWWHTIFTASANSHEVVLSPMGIGLGVYKTLAQAKAAAENNARERALNTISTARRDMGRASQVLAALGTAAPSAQSGPVGPAPESPIAEATVAASAPEGQR